MNIEIWIGRIVWRFYDAARDEEDHGATSLRRRAWSPGGSSIERAQLSLVAAETMENTMIAPGGQQDTRFAQ